MLHNRATLLQFFLTKLLISSTTVIVVRAEESLLRSSSKTTTNATSYESFSKIKETTRENEENGDNDNASSGNNSELIKGLESIAGEAIKSKVKDGISGIINNASGNNDEEKTQDQIETDSALNNEDKSENVSNEENEHMQNGMSGQSDFESNESDEIKGNDGNLLKAKVLGNNTKINFMNLDIDPEAVSLTICDACEKAVAYIVELDWNATILTETKDDRPNEETLPFYIFNIYLIQLILTPVSLVMVLFGSHLLLPISSLAASLLGVFVVFQFITYDLSCSMKLSLSIVSAILCGFLAGAFVRFGLFALGAASAGIGSYFFFDVFPQFDPIVIFVSEDELASGSLSTTYLWDVSTYGWGVITFLAIFGGIIVRWNEKVSLEFVTSVLGGVGCAYSLHSFTMIQGGQLSPSVVFLTASLLIIFGFRFQNHRRRLVDDPHYRSIYIKDDRHNYSSYLQDSPAAVSKRGYPNVRREHESWKKLQESIDSMNAMLVLKTEMERQEYERKKHDNELSMMDKIQLKNIIKEYNTRNRDDAEMNNLLDASKNV